MEDVRSRFENGSPILFRKTDPFLLPLSETLSKEDKATILIWAFSLIKETSTYLSARYSDVQIFKDAVKTVKSYLIGEVGDETRRSAIKALHNTASFIEDPADRYLIHAMGQGLSTASTRKHAMGFVVFELTSIILEYGLDEGLQRIPSRIEEYNQKLVEARMKASKLTEDDMKLIDKRVR